MMELVDVTDSKSVGGNIVWVRVPPPAPRKNELLSTGQRLVLLLYFGKNSEVLRKIR